MAMSPTEKQIKFAEVITKALDIDFPQSSKEFTKQIYCEFIKEHYDEFQKLVYFYDWDTGDEMDWFQMLNG